MKKLHRFLVESVPNSKNWTIEDSSLVHQIYQVLKIRIGERLIVFTDGGNDITLEIKEISKKSITVETISETQIIQPKTKLIAIISILKGSSFELVVQKLTELGVSAIVPLLSDRTIKQSIRLERLQSISNEALEQSGGTKRVDIYEPMELAKCFDKFKFPSVVFEIGAKSFTKQNSESIAMYIGPEGGWSEQDLELLKSHNVEFANLGEKILRADTAAIVGAFTLLQ